MSEVILPEVEISEKQQQFLDTEESKDLKRRIVETADRAIEMFATSKYKWYNKVKDQFQDVPVIYLRVETPEEFQEILDRKENVPCLFLNSEEVQSIFPGAIFKYPEDPEKVVFLFACKYNEGSITKAQYI